jgi:hypothetical protein
VTGADGKFRWTGVPPGEYELQLMHPAGSLSRQQRITVAAGETATVEISVTPDHLVEEKP